MANGAVIAIIVIVLILLLVGLGVGLYFLLRKKEEPLTPTTPPSSTPIIPPSSVPPPTPPGILPPIIPGLTGPTCPTGPGGSAPPGCTACSRPGVFLCPPNVMSAGSNGVHTVSAQISCYRFPADPVSPNVTINNLGYYWRDDNTVCPS